MDKGERDRLDRLNQEAEAEKGPHDLKAVEPRNVWPLVAWLGIAVVIAIGIIGLMYGRSHNSTASEPPAQQEAQTPQR